MQGRLITAALIAGTALAAFIVLFVTASIARADHDETLTDRQAVLDACEPSWGDDALARVTTWNGRNLHGEPFETRDLFYREWGEDNPDGNQHLRRWRWEWECLHLAPIESSPPVSQGRDGTSSSSSSRSESPSGSSSAASSSPISPPRQSPPSPSTVVSNSTPSPVATKAPPLAPIETEAPCPAYQGFAPGFPDYYRDLYQKMVGHNGWTQEAVDDHLERKFKDYIELSDGSWVLCYY